MAITVEEAIANLEKMQKFYQMHEPSEVETIKMAIRSLEGWKKVKSEIKKAADENPYLKLGSPGRIRNDARIRGLEQSMIIIDEWFGEDGEVNAFKKRARADDARDIREVV